MTTHNTQDLAAIIAQLQSQIAALEEKSTRKRGGKAPEVKAPKPYAGKNGHYFVMVPQDTAEYTATYTKVQALLGDAEKSAKFQKSQLGRAMIHTMQTTGTLFFWAPNQDDLLFGPVLPGRATATEAEIFVIPAAQLQDLGHAFEGDKAGRVAVEGLVQLESFIAMEKLQNEERKLQEKLAKLTSK